MTPPTPTRKGKGDVLPAWRIGRGWPALALRAHLAALATCIVTSPPAPGRSPNGAPAGSTASVEARPPSALPLPLPPAPGWTVECHEAILGREPPGPPLPGGLFARARQALHTYRFADPRITRAHFDPGTPLLGRDILVEVSVLLVRLLVGLRIGAVVDRTDDDCTGFGIRLDTLAGHIMQGSEWVLIAKDHRSGAVRLRIDAQWRPGQLPTWWLALGARLLGRQVQARWRRQVVRRLRALGDGPGSPRQDQ